MKLAIAVFTLSLTVASVAAGCGGSPAVTCQTTACSTGTLAYQVCANVNGSETYNFGGMSCNCSGAQCQTCAMQVANYCGGGGAGGSGGTGGGGAGGGGGGGTVTCTATFSGGVSGTYSPCAVTVTYTPGNDGTQIATAGNAIPGTVYSWTGFSMALGGMPATGTFDQTGTIGASSMISQQGNPSSPIWEAAYGQGHTYGTASLTITSLGPPTNVSGNTLYQSPHGTWTGTLADQNPTTHMPDVMETVTF